MKRQCTPGMRFGKLVIIQEAEKDKYNRPMFLARCDCGNAKVVRRASLFRGETKSCGCLGQSVMDNLCKPNSKRSIQYRILKMKYAK